jgi:hypothetical protein
MSKGSWVAWWLDELSGVSGRVLQALEKLSPRHGGRVPLGALETEMWLRWGWDEIDLRQALRRLDELALVVLHADERARLLEDLAGPFALRTHDGAVVTHLALPVGPRARASTPRCENTPASARACGGADAGALSRSPVDCRPGVQWAAAPRIAA